MTSHLGELDGPGLAAFYRDQTQNTYRMTIEKSPRTSARALFLDVT